VTVLCCLRRWFLHSHSYIPPTHSLLDGDVLFVGWYILNQSRLVVVPILPSPSVKTVTCKLCVVVLEYRMWSFSVVRSGWWLYVGLLI
jgi:hypothetical protein